MEDGQILSAGEVLEITREPDYRTNGRRRRWVNFALGFVAFAAAVSLILVWWIFRSYSPAQARLSPVTHPWFFPVLMIHIVGASVALATVPLQLWPWLRRRHPRIHRYSGRAYVFAGVYPAGIGALLLLAIWPEYPLNEFSDFVTTLLWLAATTVGLKLARERRYADHRRWMLRSFALTASFTVTLILVFPILFILDGELHSQFGGSTTAMDQVASGLDIWLSWVLPLLAVEWWLDRERLRRGPRAWGQVRDGGPGMASGPISVSGNN
jgi:uncharacterized membrane protein YozB (DUF420 family)